MSVLTSVVKIIYVCQITVLFLMERKVLDIMPHFTGINSQIRLKHVPLCLILSNLYRIGNQLVRVDSVLFVQ